MVTLFPPDSHYLNTNRITEAEIDNMSHDVAGRVQSIVNIHNPSIEVHLVDRSLNTGASVILAAGVLKVPSLAGPAGAHIHGQVAVGFIVCGIAAYLSVRFLVRWFQTRTLIPFAIYCLAFGILSILRFG